MQDSWPLYFNILVRHDLSEHPTNNVCGAISYLSTGYPGKPKVLTAEPSSAVLLDCVINSMSSSGRVLNSQIIASLLRLTALSLLSRCFLSTPCYVSLLPLKRPCSLTLDPKFGVYTYYVIYMYIRIYSPTRGANMVFRDSKPRPFSSDAINPLVDLPSLNAL